jgi:lipopolysaccharide exporter
MANDQTRPARLSLSGSSALALSTVGTNVVRIVSTMILTRLLAPEVYGIVGVITSIFYTLQMLTDFGLQAYVVRHPKTDEQNFLDSVFTIHAIRGVALAGLSMLLAWPLSRIMAKPELFAPLVVSSLFFVIDGQVSLHQFRALRDGKVKRFSIMELVTNLAQSAATIVLAFFLRNVWAIIVSMLIGSSVRAWLTYALFPGQRHRFRPDRAVSADLWRFSRVVAASSALTLIIGQVDKLALGRILPLSQFGIYVLAGTLAAAPTAFAFNYAATIVYPTVAAAFREGRSVAEAYYGCWARFFYLYAFGAGGLIGVADLLVRFLYDPRYVPVAHYLSILAVSTALTMVNRSMENVQVAMGRPRIGVEMNLTRLFWLVGGGILAMYRSSPLTFVLTMGLVEVPAYAFGVWRMAGNRITRWPRELSLLLTILAGVAVGGAGSYLGRILFPNL